MRFIEIKENTVSQGSLNSQPAYIEAINQLLKQNSQFPMGPTGAYMFTPTAGQQIQSMEDAIAGKGQDQKGNEVDQIIVKHIHKSPQIKGIGAGKADDDDTINFNAGEVAEGIHATAAFVRLITRPSKRIELANLYPIIKRLDNGKTLILKAKEASGAIADEFRVTVSLKQETWNAFKQLNVIAPYKKIATIAQNIIDDANEESGKYADMYEKNGKFDSVSVIGDGVSGETETKTDINFDNETERKYKGYSIKAGSTRQIHQVGGGSVKLPAEGRFDVINKELFGVHGRVQLINIEDSKKEFVNLWNSGKAFEAYRHAYTQAVEEINKELTTDKAENSFIKKLIMALKYWMRRDEEEVVLKQFTGTKNGTYILDVRKLDEYQDEGLNLVAIMAGTSEPTLRINDAITNKMFVEIRAKGEEKANGSVYFRNIVNKGPLFSALTNIKKSDK